MSSFITQIYKKPEIKPSDISFLDRDGTITRETDFLIDKNQISIYKNSASAISLLNKHNFLVIVITNQPVVARGWISEKELREINDKIVESLNKKGAFINAIYSCPHHPDANVEKYRILCKCRKPGIQMLKQASIDFNIKNEQGYVVGDRTSDIKCGKNFGFKTILLKTGYHGSDKRYNTKPTFVKSDILSAAKLITNSII